VKYLKKEDTLLDPEDLMKNIKEGMFMILGLGLIRYKIIKGTRDNNAKNPAVEPKCIMLTEISPSFLKVFEKRNRHFTFLQHYKQE